MTRSETRMRGCRALWRAAGSLCVVVVSPRRSRQISFSESAWHKCWRSRSPPPSRSGRECFAARSPPRSATRLRSSSWRAVPPPKSTNARTEERCASAAGEGLECHKVAVRSLLIFFEFLGILQWESLGFFGNLWDPLRFFALLIGMNSKMEQFFGILWDSLRIFGLLSKIL